MEKFNLYTWVDGGINNSWPGAEITSNTEVVNGYTYYVYQYSSDFNGKTVNAIVNNGSTQTGDIKLGVLNTNYYLVVNSLSEVKVSTTAPAAGSVEEAKEIPDTLYLKPNSNWTQANARFAAYFFGNGEKWISMTKTTINGGTYYKVSVPEGYPSVIFCRMNPSASANSWNNKWNQTGDLTIPTDGNNLFTVPDGWWDNATTGWSKL